MNQELIFISHSSADKLVADAICHKLEERGHKCWIAPRDIRQSDWAEAIMDGIHQCGVFVVIVSQHSISSPEVTKEITEAARVCRYLLPFKIDMEQLNNRLRYHLGPCHWLDAIDPPMEKHIRELIDRIEHLSDEDTVYMNRACIAFVDKPLYPCSFFIGRSHELNEIHRLLAENNVLFLEGMGGIGKSELAKAYAKEYAQHYSTIIFAHYQSGIREMLRSDEIPIRNLFRADGETADEWYSRKLDAFRALASEKTLLMIDNYDTDDDEYFPALTASPCRFLVTTRNEHPAYRSLRVEALDHSEELRRLFLSHYGRRIKDSDTVVIDEILKTVHGHTITVELIAKQMKASFLTPPQMLELLSANGLNLGLKEKVRRAESHEMHNAFDDICMLFSFSEISSEQAQIFRCMTLMPVSGISPEHMRALMELADFDAVNELIGKSWLHYDESADKIQLHPVICDVVKAKLQPDQSNCLPYIHKLWEILFPCWFMDLETRNALYPLLVSLLHTFPNPSRALFTEYCSFINTAWICGDFALALKIGETVCEFAEQEFGGYAAETVSATLAYAAAFHNAGDEQNAEPLYQKALDILIALGGDPTEKLAQCYMKVGRSAVFRGDYCAAHRYFEQSKAVYGQLIEMGVRWKGGKYPAQYEDLFVEIERLHMAEGNYKAAMAYCRQSYQYATENHGSDNTSCCYSLMDTGICCTKLGRYEEGMRYLEKALALNLKMNGAASLQTVKCREAIMDNLLLQGKKESANALLTELCMDLETYFGIKNPMTIQLHNRLMHLEN